MYGDKIRMIRELRDFSQEYVAEKLGIRQNSYSKIENNQTKLNIQRNIRVLDKIWREAAQGEIYCRPIDSLLAII